MLCSKLAGCQQQLCRPLPTSHAHMSRHHLVWMCRQHRSQHRHPLQRWYAAGDTAADAPVSEKQQQQQQQPVVLRKPVGIVFAQNKDLQGKNGPVYVEEIMPGSNAEKSGQIEAGDIVSQCSAVVLKAGKEGQYENEGYGQRPYDNWETILIDCEGREFKTVMNALKSNNERWGINTVTIVFRKPATTEEAELCRRRQKQ